MNKGLSLLLSLGYCTLSQGIFLKPATAQITSDGSTNTTVNADGNDFTIQNGDRAGSNLFHSFRDFSVPNGGSAFFNNNPDIANIFSRVTGGNISNIDGLIRANGSANLFLINPAGIIFGQGARLDIGGSFYGSSADSILFEDGEFSATDLDNPPLLTINAPIGLNFRDNPGDIVNNSVPDDNSSLSVSPGATFALLGGDVNFTGGAIDSSGSNVFIGGLSESGTISLDDNFHPSFPDGVARADVSLTNGAMVDVRAGRGGSITVNARNLEVREESQLLAGIGEGLGTPEAQAGEITIRATENVTVDDSSISNQVASKALGNAGAITINTGSLSLTNGAEVNANTGGVGDAGAIAITVTDSVTLEGGDIFSAVERGAQGTAGGITINTGSLSLIDGAALSSSTLGVGDAKAITINATDAISLSGESSDGFVSAISSKVARRARGTAGVITIKTGSLSLTDGAAVSSSTRGVGDAGAITINATDAISLSGESSRLIGSEIFSQVEPGGQGTAGEITINTGSFSITDGAQLTASTFGVGDAGAITITATESVTLSGELSRGLGSAIFSRVNPGAQGTSGGITINTGFLSLTDGALLDASTFGVGNAGAVIINATNAIFLSGKDSQGFESGIFSQVGEPGGQGRAGGITINTGSLSLTDGALVSANTEGEGEAGNIFITANKLEVTSGSQIQTNTTTNFKAADITLEISDNIFLSGTDSGLFAQTAGAEDAGKIIINTPRLTIDQGASISAFTTASGDGGTITVNAPQAVLLTDNSKLTVETSSAGKPGDITITTPNLTIGKDAEISATATQNSTNTEGGGSITVNASSLDLTGKLGIFAETQGVAPAGTLNIQPDNNKPNLDIQFTDTAIISASTTASGTGGDINLTAPETINITGQGKLAVETRGTGDAGNINITTQNFNISKQTEISASTFSSGQAGDIKITANNFNLEEDATVITKTAGSGQAGDIQLQIMDNLNLVNSSIAASTNQNSTGRGGNINIDPQSVTIQDGATIAVNSDGSGTGGSITLAAEELTLDNGSITAETASNQGGNITLTVGDILQFINDGQITASAGTAQAGGDGGNVTINSDFILAFPTENTYQITANAFEGDGGNIQLTTNSFFGREFVNITASSEFGLSGNVTINTLEVDPTKGLVELPTNLVDPSEQIDKACTPGSPQRQSSFVVTGRGGLPLSPTEPLQDASSLTQWVKPRTSPPNPAQVEIEPPAQYPDIKPIKTSMGDIYPARGIIKTEDGQIILTPYPTDNIAPRTPQISPNCS